MTTALRRLGPAGRWAPVVALGLVMAVSAALMLWMQRGTTLYSDELYYYAHLVGRGGGLETLPFGPEYLLAPYSGHLQVLGKLLYELLFASAGTAYLAYRIVAVALYLLCAGLFFGLARRRVGAGPALAGATVLLFLGAGWELMLWPFDLHTLAALAAGLGALAVLERGGRRADLACCVLLAVSIATIEVGLAFAVGVAVAILLSPGGRSRLWVFAIPLVLYGIWALWARRFGQSETDPSYLADLATSLPASLAATVGSLTGLIDAGSGSFPYLVGVRGPDLVLAILLILALGYRISRGSVPASTWALLATLLAYWTSIALAHREPDSTRYMFAGGVLVLLVAADSVRDAPRRGWWTLLAFALVAVALPLNLVKLSDGRAVLVEQARASRAEYAMLELARGRVDPSYAPSRDPSVAAVAPVPDRGLTAGQYLAAADRFGSLGFSPAELREQPEQVRRGADASLIGALGTALRPAAAPARLGTCASLTAGATRAGHRLSPPGALIGVPGRARVTVALERFSSGAGGVELAAVRPGSWSRLEIAPDAAPDAWRLYSDGPLRVCPLDPGRAPG